MHSSLRHVFVALFIAGASTPAAAEDMSGSWRIDVQNGKHELVTTLRVRFTQQVAPSCLGDEKWSRIIVESHSTRDEKFFPISDPLAFQLKGRELTIGQVEVCDSYLLLVGTLSKQSASGRYIALWLDGENSLGFFRLTKQKRVSVNIGDATRRK
jgi:hypothetical protein